MGVDYPVAAPACSGLPALVTGPVTRRVVAGWPLWYKARALQATKSTHVPTRTAGCLVQQ
jgi:hypothetical protein